MKKIKKLIFASLAILSMSFVALPTVSAINVFDDACSGDAANTALCEDSNSGKTVPTVVKTIVNTMLYVLGAVAVIVIIFAGVFYITSMGNATSIEKAKNTLMYAVIGLVVAILAYAIVNFVITTI